MAFARRNVLFGIAALPASTLLAGRPLPGLTATVYNGSELHTAIRVAGPGSTIMLAPGNYGDIGQFTLASSNISVRVQNSLRTVLRSRLVVNGNLVDLDGLAFEEGLVLIGDGLKVSGSSFRGKGIDVAGVNTEVANCEISFFTGKGITIKGTASNPHVHHNFIHDARGHGGECEAIQIGQSMNDTNRRVGALIESNRLERCDAESEAISVKSSGNVLRNNTLTDSKAYIVNRHGSNNLYQGNTVTNAYGIVIHGADNKVIGNRCTNSILKRSIRIMGGNIPASSDRQGGHPQAMNTLVSGNTADYLVIGDQFPGHNLPAVNTTVQGHSGPVMLKDEVGTKLSGANVVQNEGGGNGGGGKKDNDRKDRDKKDNDKKDNDRNKNKKKDDDKKDKDRKNGKNDNDDRKNKNKSRGNNNKKKDKDKKTRSAFYFLHGLDLSMFS